MFKLRCMDNYEIIEITSKDLWRCESFWYNGGNNEESRLVELMKSGECRTFAYKVNNDYIGGFTISIRLNENDVYGHFSYFSVRSDLRSQGIGSRIIAYAIDHLRENGIDKIRLNVHKNNSDAIRFHHKTGFIYDEDIKLQW